MTPEQAQALYPLTQDVRRLFHILGAAVNDLHAEDGLTGGMRGVLESLQGGGAQTVPELARARPVSRQHIQSIVNQLLDADLVEYRDNPAHRRSKLVALTAQGAELFEAARKRERTALGRLELDLTRQELDDARRVITEIAATFQGRAWQTIVKGAKS